MKQSHDRRVKRTQKAIWKAFSKLILEKDFSEVTINDLSQAADINRSTFYLHFEDKYALLDAYLLSLLPFDVFITDAYYRENQEQILQESLGLLYDCLMDNAALFKRLFSEANYPFVMISARKALKEFFCHHENLFAANMADSKEFTTHIRIAGLIAMIEWLLNHETYERQQFVKESYDLISRLEITH
ncbi:TetR/AcrR family transcriptional regulator [Streptococcus dentiloxodontae]